MREEERSSRAVVQPSSRLAHAPLQPLCLLRLVDSGFLATHPPHPHHHVAPDSLLSHLHLELHRAPFLHVASSFTASQKTASLRSSYLEAEIVFFFTYVIVYFRWCSRHTGLISGIKKQ